MENHGDRRRTKACVPWCSASLRALPVRYSPAASSQASCSRSPSDPLTFAGVAALFFSVGWPPAVVRPCTPRASIPSRRCASSESRVRGRTRLRTRLRSAVPDLRSPPAGCTRPRSVPPPPQLPPHSLPHRALWSGPQLELVFRDARRFTPHVHCLPRQRNQAVQPLDAPEALLHIDRHAVAHTPQLLLGLRGLRLPLRSRCAPSRLPQSNRSRSGAGPSRIFRAKNGTPFWYTCCERR